MCRWSDDSSSVSCICRRGFKGERCQVKDKEYTKHRSTATKHVDSDEEVNGDVVKIVASIFGVVATIAALVLVAFIWQRRKLSEAFKHRRMAESLVNGGGTNNMEFPNQMYLREHSDDDNARSDVATNFVNPVYETMFSPEEVDLEENSGLLSIHDDRDAYNDVAESESADLLTERHRGNISL
jgi:hypothetical protein